MPIFPGRGSCGPPVLLPVVVVVGSAGPRLSPLGLYGCGGRVVLGSGPWAVVVVVLASRFPVLCDRAGGRGLLAALWAGWPVATVRLTDRRSEGLWVQYTWSWGTLT